MLLRREKGEGSVPGREERVKGESHWHAPERKSHNGSSLRVFILRSQGRIPVEYAPASKVCPFRVVVSTDWWVPEQGVY